MPIADEPGLRPTSERIRETLFNWLAPTIDGASCLDLFAGTGALGIEAMSRGAHSVDLVEHSPEAARLLRENVDLLAIAGARVLTTDAYAYLRQTPGGRRYDLVFLDPPFADGRYGELCKLLDEGGWLSPAAAVYIEMDRKQSLPDLPAGWTAVKEKTAGSVRYALLRAKQ